MRNTLLLFLLSVLVLACGKNATTENDQQDSQTTTVTEEPAPPTVQLTDFTPSPSFDAKITDYSYKNGKFSFDIAATDYELGAQTTDAETKMCANSGKGQHIHLIIDNKPYAAKYDADFDYDIADGDHYLLAFLSRSYHESIKSEGAAVTNAITVKDGAITKSDAITAPMLFYSRPKGSYMGKGNIEKIMLDFYVANLELGDNYKVKVDVNDSASFTVDSWKPYFLENLPLGENTVTLTLVDEKGNTIDTPLNPVSRTFTVAASPEG